MDTLPSEAMLSGADDACAAAVDDVRSRFGIDFVALGLAAYAGAPLRWLYGAGATNERYRRIALPPGRGIGGIVLKAGRPLLVSDIDAQIDPREFSSYPIVFAEGLQSFCALPVCAAGRTVGVLLAAFRHGGDQTAKAYRRMVEGLDETFCGLGLVKGDFIAVEAVPADASPQPDGMPYSDLTRMMEAQEAERTRISRKLHDELAQDMLGLSFLLKRIEAQAGGNGAGQAELLAQAQGSLDRMLGQVRDLSVELRPTTLDHFGLAAALRSQGLVLEATYGARVRFEVDDDVPRLGSIVETQLYRITVEAMLNACRYSGADEVLVRVTTSGDALCINVVDHGVGFDVDSPAIRGGGCGLPGMRERASVIGARLTVASGEGGTTVALAMPIGRDTARDDEADREQDKTARLDARGSERG